MLLVRSLVLAAWAISAIDGEDLWRRLIFGPGGDPSHQGGHLIRYPPSQQSKCVTPNNPCRCPMNFVTEMNCLECNCTNFLQTGSFPGQTTGLFQPTSTPAVPSSAGTTTTTKTTTTTLFPSVPPIATSTTGTNAKITTKIDYCEVAKQLCQANCPDGYLIDPADCTFCVCKKDILSG